MIVCSLLKYLTVSPTDYNTYDYEQNTHHACKSKYRSVIDVCCCIVCIVQHHIICVANWDVIHTPYCIRDWKDSTTYQQGNCLEGLDSL